MGCLGRSLGREAERHITCGLVRALRDVAEPLAQDPTSPATPPSPPEVRWDYTASPGQQM